MKAIVLNKIGKPNVLTISEVPIPTVLKNEVLIKIKYAGVNYADLLTRQGLYSWAPKRPNILGLEATGEIIQIGSDVKSLKKGDRVFVGMQKGGYAEFISIEEQFARKVPQFYNWEEAGAFGAQWFTAWIALFEMARVREDEILLVHSAAGGAGSAAVKLGISFGLKVYGTCSPHKKGIIEKMGATYLSYENFDKQLVSNSKRPMCVFETVGGNIFKRSLDCLAPMGRVIVVGASGIKVNKKNPLSIYRAIKSIPKVNMKDVLRPTKGFMGLHIGYLLDYPNLIIPKWNEMINFIELNQLRPVYQDDQIFPMSKASKAHQLIHDRKNIGKVLLDPSS